MQRPVYYVSKVLLDAERRYTTTEKFVLALHTSAKRLRPYFQSHPIVVLTDRPLKQILANPEASGRLVKWSISLGAYDITFKPRTAIKGQALADFIAECSIPLQDEPEGGNTPAWEIFVDGSSCSTGSGAGIILKSPEGIVLQYALRFKFPASNNMAEYEALISGMKLAKQLGAQRVISYSDSQLVAGQFNGDFEAREPQMIKYLELVQRLAKCFESFRVIHIAREDNAQADALSKLASSAQVISSRSVLVEELTQTSTSEVEQVEVVEEGDTWMTPYILWLTHNIAPSDPHEARRFKYQARRFVLVDGQLYRRSFSAPLLKCLGPIESLRAIEEVHEGICGVHLGGRSLARILLRLGYWWPTLQLDCSDYVRRCDRCQRYDHLHHKPATNLTSLSEPYPFARWGIDILGPFPQAQGQKKFIIVAIDYFTKWIEAEATAQITDRVIWKFVWQSIVCRFGIPRVIISDNGRQFNCSYFREKCAELKIGNHFTSVAHPQANGQVENANRTLLKGIKTRLEGSKGSWLEELPSVLWAYRTTPRASTGETPFCLAYGTEAVIPLEVGSPSLRVNFYHDQRNDLYLRENLDLVEELREKARLRTTEYQRRMARYYNRQVRERHFLPGDLVLRKAEASKPLEAAGKLAANWEGPYQILESLGKGAYRLKALDGTLIPRTWHVGSLRRYFY